ncbi:MarR family winged helix-turn-helix transcriptional regulator [Microbacterium paludicola]|uniref:MarR family transcriptional regulator n=1 Tax=Microbacterium paludicola TaxID=300019 RepID=A0A4Y9FYH2_9MICO|nr:MarR family transcriptional regulator [Microbacterium paludicola]MBF0815776.1 MarR family transcriptional regulator [Microbacterium paludicola]TFU33608.1 MarR family transcriptional regulator [Microbacterium paludicola]
MAPTILDHLLLVSELFQRDMARAFAGTTLTTARVRVLWLLHHRGPSTQRELAQDLDVSARNVSGLVDALEASGHVIRTPHPMDRRATVVTLTDAAAEQMAAMQRDHAHLSTTLLDAVAPQDRAPLERGIVAIAARLAELVDAAERTDTEGAR